MNVSKIVFASVLSLVFSAAAFAQVPQQVAISDEGVANSDNCQEYFILSDSDVNGGNYGSNEDFEITLCFNDIEMSNAQVQILPASAGTGSVWDVDGNSSLFIYQGTGSGGVLLGEFNSVSDPNGVFFTTASACLTFVFVSGNNSSGAGFIAEFKCVEPLQPFNLDVATLPPAEFSDIEVDGIPDDSYILTICYGDTVRLEALLDFPLSDATGNGYAQSIENTNITYNWGDSSFDSGLGLTSASHAYTPFGGFYVLITAEDQMGQIELTEVFVLVSPRPVFSGLLFDDILCAGDTTQLTGGILGMDTVGVGPSTGLVNINYEFNDSLALPDGSGVLYSTAIDIAGFVGGSVLTDPGDIESICINVEHSYLGDLEAWITCPNGSTALLFDGFGGTGQYPNGQVGFGGGGTFLGDAVDNDGTAGVQGVGFDYCFSDIFANLGTMADEHPQNTVPVTMGNAMVSGTYLPAESFDNLNGCPLNGPWTLSFADNIGSDNGFIFGWEITFSDIFPRDSIFYTPDIVDAYWAENADIVVNEDTIITVVPSEPGFNQFTFVVEDSFGCLHDTTFNVFVRPMPVIQDAIACNREWQLVPTNVPNDWVWNTLLRPTPSALASFENLEFGQAIVNVSEFGIYAFEIVESNCSYRDTALVDFRPDPQIVPFPGDTTLCSGSSILLDGGPQLPNSDNFVLNWTLNGATINTTDYSIVADQTGTYELTINGFCGSVSESTDVVSIQINFQGDTICGLQSFGQVTVAPEGNGLWSADTEEISFSNVNLLSTSISAQNYGEYAITYTDNRCTNDGVSQLFRFVEQPVPTILPEDPEFCVESDVLTLTVETTGSNRGTYFWAVNGTTEITNNDTILFAPMFFEPLETYAITVLVQDEYQVCPLGEGEVVFEGLWCTYNIPNIITPNGDRANDRFHIEFLEYFPASSLRIYDRWGKLVFEEANYDQYQISIANGGGTEQGGWDGGDVESGTYFYELLLPHVRKIETGYLEVIDSRN